jgi:hypothetical protein
VLGGWLHCNASNIITDSDKPDRLTADAISTYNANKSAPVYSCKNSRWVSDSPRRDNIKPPTDHVISLSEQYSSQKLPSAVKPKTAPNKSGSITVQHPYTKASDMVFTRPPQSVSLYQEARENSISSIDVDCYSQCSVEKVQQAGVVGVMNAIVYSMLGSGLDDDDDDDDDYMSADDFHTGVPMSRIERLRMYTLIALLSVMVAFVWVKLVAFVDEVDDA